MTDSPRRDGPVPPNQPQEPQKYGWRSETDPAYAYPPPLFGNHYQSPADANATQELPANWSPGGHDPSWAPTQSATPFGGGVPPQQPPYQSQYQPPDAGGQPPGGPGPRIWLWVLAGVAVLLVIGMVAALFIVSGSEEQTVVAPPLQTATATTTPRPTTTTTTTTRPPSQSTTAGPTESATPGATEEVVYNVSGSGKAINITYIDEGGVLQTEFNVMLPWTKTVQLAAPAKDSASVSIVTFGREVSCTVTVAGVQVSTKTGSALTVCSGKL